MCGLDLHLKVQDQGHTKKNWVFNPSKRKICGGMATQYIQKCRKNIPLSENVYFYGVLITLCKDMDILLKIHRKKNENIPWAGWSSVNNCITNILTQKKNKTLTSQYKTDINKDHDQR